MYWKINAWKCLLFSTSNTPVRKRSPSTIGRFVMLYSFALIKAISWMANKMWLLIWKKNKQFTRNLLTFLRLLLLFFSGESKRTISVDRGQPTRSNCVHNYYSCSLARIIGFGRHRPGGSCKSLACRTPFIRTPRVANGRFGRGVISSKGGDSICLFRANKSNERYVECEIKLKAVDGKRFVPG